MYLQSRIGPGQPLLSKSKNRALTCQPQITHAKKKSGPASSSGPIKPAGERFLSALKKIVLAIAWLTYEKTGPGGAATTEKPRPKGDVRQGGAYSQETRKIILGLDKITKRTSNGKELLKNINIGMYLGAKIGVLGANGSGKSTLMKILAGIDQNCEGRVNLTPGIRVALLEQEPELKDGLTVGSNIEVAVKAVRALLNEYEELGLKMGDPSADIDALRGKMDRLQSAIEAINGWEIDRTVDQAMDSLRCPPSEALVDNLSGGERRRVALASFVLVCPLLYSFPFTTPLIYIRLVSSFHRRTFFCSTSLPTI